MKKYFSLAALLLLVGAANVHAQYRVYAQPRYVRPARVVRVNDFQPRLNINIGYGFPNLDKYQLGEFTNAYKGTVSQTGPVTGSIDYQFSRYTSVGIMGTYGKVSMPYYDRGGDGTTPAFTGKLENWSIMFNLVNYFPSYNRAFTPYLRTAAGVNNWTQTYTDASGAKAADAPTPTLFAYQVSLGTRINMSPNAGFFMEAGYGKYILSAGLQFRL